MTKWGFCLILMLAGCAKPATHKTQVSIDPELEPLVTQFLQDATAQGLDIQVADLVVRFGAITDFSDAVGECLLAPNQTPVITINNVETTEINSWDELSPDQQEILIYHELGHCLLGRVHDNGFWVSSIWDPNGTIYNSVMNWEATQRLTFYKNYRDHYMEELFK